ncbi:MAG: ribbon-helix-helix protein, CopG family [Anaerolineae bacterium]|nr:ribbon-helix-helix protein, CopG family [Anaerolineae bacterium]MCK4452157.1 ribbon-helix-helix protein, CopG family [Anaerolineae bacterium]
MSVVKIGISLPHPLLKRVDTAARRKGQSRSEFVRRSLERTLVEDVPLRVLAEARALYAAIEEDDHALAEDFLTVAAETLPPYKEVGS